MRHTLLTLLLIINFSASAKASIVAASEDQILGVAYGIYEADGTLVSSSDFLPDLQFHSTRRLQNDVIEATTTASLLGIDAATVSARLQISIKSASASSQQFDVLDVDNNLQKAGEGSCDQTSCTFTATVMNGSLTLTETWVATENGFDMENCSQTFKGNDATYKGEFHRRGNQ